jgi:hypothetical protein
VFQRNILPSSSRVKESCFYASMPLKLKMVNSFEMSGIENPATQCNNSPDPSVYTVYTHEDRSR